MPFWTFANRLSFNAKMDHSIELTGLIACTPGIPQNHLLTATNHCNRAFLLHLLFQVMEGHELIPQCAAQCVTYKHLIY